MPILNLLCLPTLILTHTWRPSQAEPQIGVVKRLCKMTEEPYMYLVIQSLQEVLQVLHHLGPLWVQVLLAHQLALGVQCHP